MFSSVGITGNTLQLDVLPHENGTATIAVTAQDLQGATAVFNLGVTINAVPDQPTVVGAVPNLVTDEDVNASVSLAGVFDDVDIVTNGETLGYSVISNSNPAVAVASMSGDVLSVLLVADLFGTGDVGRARHRRCGSV